MHVLWRRGTIRARRALPPHQRRHKFITFGYTVLASISDPSRQCIQSFKHLQFSVPLVVRKFCA